MKRVLQLMSASLLGVILVFTIISISHADKPWTLLARRAIIDDSLRVGGPVTINGTLTINGATGGITAGTPVTIASATTLTLPDGRFFYDTSASGKTTRLLLTTVTTGTIVTIVTAGTDTLVDGVNLKLAGNFNGTADDAITLIYGVANDTSWYEVSRSAN